MTAEELAICRLSIAMGMVPSVIVQMSATDFDLLGRYWNEEPWGAWRDNVHAAIIAREIRRPYVKDQSTIKLDDFMVRHPDDREEERAEKQQQRIVTLFHAFKSFARRVKKGSKDDPSVKSRKVKP